MIAKAGSFFHYGKNFYLKKEQVIALQNKKLQRIISHAYKTSPFYREWMEKAGISPEDIKCANDLNKIPPLTKDLIRDNYKTVISDKYSEEDCFIRYTSGSSGKMLRVLWDKKNFWSRVLLTYRAFSMIGYSPFKKLVYFLPVVEDPGFTFFLFRQMGLTFDKPFEEIRNILLKNKPDVISIYPSYALDLSEHLSNEDISEMGIKAISLNSEMILSHDKLMIEEKYKCPVFEEYSSVEFGIIASMCKNQGMHIFSDNVIVEILDKNGNIVKPGEVGEVTLTALNSFAMPFIRYRIGDYSSIRYGECSCGCSFPMMGKIEGRKDDSFTMQDGKRIPAWQIYEIVERPLEEYGVEKLILHDFYLAQKNYNMAEFYYVKGPDFCESYIEKLNIGTRKLFGNDFVLNIKELQDMNRVKSVKRKYIHCEITE